MGQGADITALTSGSDTLFIGTSVGIVHVVNSAFKIVRSFPTYDNDSEHVGSIRHIKQVEGTKLLVTVSEDLSAEPVLKVWALDKTERKTGLPRCQSTVTIQNGRRQFPVSLFTEVFRRGVTNRGYRYLRSLLRLRCRLLPSGLLTGLLCSSVAI